MKRAALPVPDPRWLAPAARRTALELSGALWAGATRGFSAYRPADAGAQAALAADALGAGLAAGPVRVVGPGAEALAAPLAARAHGVPEPGEAVVVLGLERLRPRAAADRLRALRPAGLVVLLLPLWPAGRAAAGRGARTLHTRRWWLARAAEVGLEEAVELRSPAARAGCLVLAPVAPPRPTPQRPPRRASARPDAVVRINDDLALGNSFAWISASIALALDDLGVPVSVAPTGLSTSMERERRERLAALIERGPAPARVDAEIGWTHFWPAYRRPIGGRVPLALFAINYRFARRDPAGYDPWLRGLVASPQPLAPISSFCRDVLAEAGVPGERLRIVPLAATDGILDAPSAPLRGARGLKLLHVTNTADLERNGTDLALAAMADAYAPGDDVTLVVRDYGSYAPDLAAQVWALAQRGYDVRYWPAFFPPERLGSFLGAFDALLAPFRGEGFGIKVLDAMGCGVPPIAPFFGGPRDFLTEDTAFSVAHDLVPVAGGYDSQNLALGNEPLWAQCRPDALAAALRTALADPADVARRGAKARERVLGGFTWRHTAEHIVALLDP